MIQIGKFRMGFAALSMMVVFVVLSTCAVTAAFIQASPEYPVPLTHLILVYEVMSLMATLVYGIFAHFTIEAIDKIRK